MKKLLILVCAVLASCASSNKIKQKKTNVEDLTSKYRLYSVQNNSYFYFMLDSTGGPYLVKTHAFKPERVIWIEKLYKKN